MTELNREIIEEEAVSEQTVANPYDPAEISIDKKDLLVETCVKRLLQRTFVLHPEFQRKEVWDQVRKSRLIESLMLKIPIPMFYVSADEKNVFTMVDGLQRMSSLRDFIIGADYLESRDESLRGCGMKLKGLEFWTQYNGCTFNELPTYLQNRITETELTFTIINPGTPEEVKRNIFKRINTGGLYLNQQEIRNALYSGESTRLLQSLSTSEPFLNATDKAVNSTRMGDFDLILRCLAFMLRDKENYPKNDSMDAFLSDTMQLINTYPGFDTSDIAKLVKRGSLDLSKVRRISPQELSERFINGMSRAYKLFGRHSFRRSYGDMKRSPINKALFEMWGAGLSDINDDEFQHIFDQKENLQKEYEEILNDGSFQNLISRDSWKYASVQKRFDKIFGLINKYKTEVIS